VIHGCLCLLAVGPIVWRSEHRVASRWLAFIGRLGIDLDHFIAAGSLNLHTIEPLGGRAGHPFARVRARALAVVALLLTGRLAGRLAVFAVNLATWLFDAAGGGVHILYPLRPPRRAAVAVSPIGTLALFRHQRGYRRTLARPGRNPTREPHVTTSAPVVSACEAVQIVKVPA